MSKFEDIFQPYSAEEVIERKKKYPTQGYEILFTTPAPDNSRFCQTLLNQRRSIEELMRVPQWMLEPLCPSSPTLMITRTT